jgi:hypothetical protein
MMEEQIYIFQIPVTALPECKENILKVLKSDQGQSGQEITRIVADLDKESHNHLEIRGGFRVIGNRNIKIGENSLICDQIEFHSQTTIARQLDGSTGLAFFAVTLGSAFDAWSRNYFSQDDPFCGYVADLIGSVRADQAADWLETELSTQMEIKNLRCTNRFSPGYCGWDVSEQHKLFSLFPGKFLGIELTASALMTPLKSISGIIGIGENVAKLPYTCDFCELEQCFMRRLE